MTEHPTSHNRRQTATSAAAPGAAAPDDAHGAVPDPRTAVRQTAAPGQEPGDGRPRPAYPTDGPAGPAAHDGPPGPAGEPAPRARGRGAAPERGEGADRTGPARRGRGRNGADGAGGRGSAAAARGDGGRERRNTAESEHPAQPEHGTPEGEPVWDADHNAARGASRRPGANGGTGPDEQPPAAQGDGRGRGAARRGAGAGEHPERPGGAHAAAAPGGAQAAAGSGEAHTAAATAGEVGYSAPEGGVPTVPPAGGSAAAEAAAEAATARDRGGDRLRFVGAATRRIARGIDLDEIVLGLCRATVPTFADAILVYLRDPLPVGDERPVGPVVLRLRRTDRIPLDPDTDSGRLSLLPSQPDLSPAVGGGPAAELCEVEAGGPLAEVLRGVRPVFGDSQAARAALPELLGEGPSVATGQRTVLAPLRGRRRVIGAAVFVRRPDRPPFEPDDLLVAAQLATHTALGVDKAVLYGREVYIADELQRTMLPDSLPQPTGVRLASRYLPAAETARVGGDWYDAIPLPGNRVALVVGDVMGHSMTSAAIMGQLRTTAQTLAGLDLPPQEVLHHLDEQAQRLGTDRMATCLYAVYDPVAHRIVVANAGHPPPLLLHRGGRAEVLRVPPGAPIGVGGVDFEAVELDAPAGATLMLYTDGLVESRMRDVWTGIEQLRERLTATARLTGPNPPPLEPLCDEVLDMLGPGDRDDDVALLAARFEGIAPSDVAYWFLDPKAQTAGQARRLARRALARWDLDDLTDAVELLVSEVVTNAVRYAERPITLRLLRTDVLRCEVGDDVPQLPRLRQARPSDEGGRGLYLVNRMARRWGATRLSTGKVVWFELAMPS
ncbi:SpoIIE family protein phosphatase [Streptomyces rapamycinicus]|uniref:protein-serine/threonine phosphatase n=2 Tax=Streptomyces rapamycinicus TaxID=1226757 RepID=A0A3L8RPA5_STRRN|nr:SpoIIE family protein phosphatase [Streptomyces rapamycinicus]MBB4782855.1 serine phosphatase RsbU (regulator of sigma subunit)/anti-sigma regulatory factor (Ser/Thr protein kinase) [Streptomyces rapamycinicus]RLV81665.1 serine/threonine protein phosphatase [Streptomyces rapamycinicus NRRL 5491]UTO63322.1 SpoIIE family protein phosphatase [Streptomyces rapamycinicus]UTP31280.1 SpoIIE family protein phosphatase [Streptomyces rapamycinicus NRRL 5491]